MIGGAGAYRFEFNAMGGGCELLLCAPDKLRARAAAEIAVGEVRRIEQKYSRYRQDSVVSQINSQAGTGQWMLCDRETNWLLDYAETLYRSSDGFFDITSGVLRRIWDFAAAVIPGEAEIQALLPLIGWGEVERGEGRIRLPRAGMEVDFGGFGKEYAADSAAETLARQGITHGYVNLGGDIRVMGPQPDGKPWLMAIQHPRQRGQIIATIPVYQGGLTTSGDYEKFFEQDGRRYCHVLNPGTGMPVAYWRSVSILAPLAIMAGSYSTVAMLKEEVGIDWLKQSGLPYLAVASNGELIRSG